MLWVYSSRILSNPSFFCDWIVGTVLVSILFVSLQLLLFLPVIRRRICRQLHIPVPLWSAVIGDCIRISNITMFLIIMVSASVRVALLFTFSAVPHTRRVCRLIIPCFWHVLHKAAESCDQYPDPISSNRPANLVANGQRH